MMIYALTLWVPEVLMKEEAFSKTGGGNLIEKFADSRVIFILTQLM